MHASPYDYAEAWPAQTWQAATPLEVAMAAGLAPKTEAVFVVGNHGRWVVSCPDCNGAQLGCVADHRFMCNECANIAIGGLWRPVVWPAEVHDISAVIADRADRAMQNFEPGETLAELREQNAVLADSTVVDGIVVRGGAALPEYPDFAGHHHDYPAKVAATEFYTCADPVCGHPELGRDITALRKSKVLR